MTTSLKNKPYQSPHQMLSDKKNDHQGYNQKHSTEDVRKSVPNFEQPDTFEYKNLELSNFLNKKRQELELLNSQLASHNPDLYELVKQHEKEYVHSSSNSPFKENKSPIRDPEWLDRDVEREKRFKLREQERMKHNKDLLRKSEQMSDLKTHGEINSKRNKLAALNKEHAPAPTNIKGRNSTQNKLEKHDNQIGKRQGHTAEKPGRSPVTNQSERKSLVSQTNKDLSKKQENYKLKDHNKENQSANVPVKHAQKSVTRENQINISDIYDHHPHPMKQDKQSLKQKKLDSEHDNDSHSQHQQQRLNQFSKDNHKGENSEFQSKNNNKEQDFQKSPHNTTGQSENDAQFLDKIYEGDLKRSKLKSEEARRYAEEVRKQMETHEEQKKKAQQRKKEEEAREAEKAQREVEEALKKVERSSGKEDNRNFTSSDKNSNVKSNENKSSPHSDASFENVSPSRQGTLLDKNPQAQQKSGNKLYPNDFNQVIENAYVNRHDNSNMSHKDVSGIGLQFSEKSSIIGNGQEKSFDLNEENPEKKQLADRLKEEKLKAQNITLQEQLLYEQYKNKIKDIELEKMMHMRQMQNIETLMSHSMLPIQSHPLFDFSISPITRKSSQMSGIGPSPFGASSAQAQNFGAQARLVASMPPQKFDEQHQHKPPFNVSNENEEDDAISIEADSLEQSFFEKSLPSTHYECQITKDQLQESYQKDLKTLKQLTSQRKEQAKSNKKPREFKPEKMEYSSQQKKSNSKDKNSEDKLIYSIDNMGLMMTPAASEAKKVGKTGSTPQVEDEKSLSSSSSGENGQETEKEEPLKGSDGFKQETGKFPVYQSNKEDIFELESRSSKGFNEPKENLHKRRQKDNIDKSDKKYETPFKQKDYFSKRFGLTDINKKGSEEKVQEKELISGLDKESKHKIKDYLDLTTPQSTSSQRTSLSNKKYKSPKAIDPFSKRNEQESLKASTKQIVSREKSGEEIAALEWKRRVHDILQNKAPQMERKINKDLDRQKELQQNLDQVSLESTGDLRRAERMAREMEEEELCIEEYEKQINESTKKKGIDRDHHNGDQNKNHSSHRKQISPPKNADDEDLEEIEASEQSEHPSPKKPQRYQDIERYSKHSTQRQSTKDWLGPKKPERQHDQEVIEIETGNWEDLKWELAQKGLIEVEDNGRKTQEKRSETILHKLEELLYDWTHTESDQENIDSNKYPNK